MELINDSTRGATCQISRGDEQVLDGQLFATTASGRTSGALQMEIRLSGGATVEATRWVGRSLYLWVPHARGILAFTAPVLSAAPKAIRVGLPREIVR